MTRPPRTLAVVQARTGSSRLPGKVLMDVGGRSVLGLMLARLGRLAVDDLVVATSDLPQDDPVVHEASRAGAAVVRGSERDVLGRFQAALDARPADLVVRLTADCPLLDPGLAAQVLAATVEGGWDHGSNTLVRTYPDGLDVEVISAAALTAAAEEAEAPDEREHVTPFVYRRPERFRLGSVVHPEPLGHERWTLDTADDLDRLRSIVDRLDDPVTAGWSQVLDVAGRSAPPALWLRPLVTVDDVRLPSGPPGAVTGQVALGLPLRPAHPATRAWAVVVRGSVRGWVAAERCAGTWAVRGATWGDGAAALLDQVVGVLRADPQLAGVRAAVLG